MSLALSSQDSLLVYRKTVGVAIEGEELVNLIIVLAHDDNAVLLDRIYHLVDRLSNLPPRRRMHKGGHCSLGGGGGGGGGGGHYIHSDDVPMQ